jgi:hypothetical protein
MDAANHQKITFLVEMSDGKLEEIIAYNELTSSITKNQHEAKVRQPDSASWAFEGTITEHQGGLLNPSDIPCNGSSYNFLVHL